MRRQRDPRLATPLFIVVLLMEVSDVMFAILGLRSIGFALTGVMDTVHGLKISLGVVLVYVDVKMLRVSRSFGVHLP